MLNRFLKFFVFTLLVFSLSLFSKEGIWKSGYLPVDYNRVEKSIFTGYSKAGNTVILQEDFEDVWPGWTYVDGNSDGVFWQVGTTNDLSSYTPPDYGTQYAFYSDDDAGPGINTNEEWISPALGIPPYSDSLKLQYGWGFNIWEPGEELRVYARFFNGSWGSWNLIQTYNADGSGTEEIDLSGYLPADSVQVRWLYNDEASSIHYGWACAVDNVIITAHVPQWIVSVTPPDGSTGIPGNALIQAKFITAMKPSTINTNNVYLRTFTTGPGGGAWSLPISGSVTYNPNDSTVTFVPTGVWLADNQEYYLTISGNVQDTNGVPMGSDYTWSWTTYPQTHIERAFIANGRFREGLKGWRIYSLQGTGTSQPNTVDLIDLGGENYAARIVRTQTALDGGVLGITQQIDGYVGPVPYLYLTADLYLASGYPPSLRNVRVIVSTSKGNWVGTYTTVGSWMHIVSPNLIEELGLESDDVINYVFIGNNSYAWGFEIYVDNVGFSYVKDGSIPNVLLLSAESDFTYLRENLMQFGDITNVDYLNGTSNIPTLSYLSNYDAVIVIDGNYGWADDTAMGDTLYQYLQNGGGIVMGGVCWDPQPGGTYSLAGLNGSIMSPGANPYTKDIGSIFDYYSLGWFDPYHPVMWDVDEFGGLVYDSVTLSPWADTIAKFAGHTFGIAAKQQFVGIPGYWGWQTGWTGCPYGDYVELIHNAIMWSVHPFINGGFQTGDRLGWTFYNIQGVGQPETQYEIVSVGGEIGNALRMYRAHCFDGGMGEMFQRFKEDVSGWTNVTLSFYVRIDLQEQQGNLALYHEYPAQVHVLYENSYGGKQYFVKYFYLNATNVDPEAEQLPSAGVWYLKQYDLKATKLDIQKILGVYLSSSGWGFDAYFADVKIVNSPVGIEEEKKNLKVELLNGFGSNTEIRLFIPEKGKVNISLFNISGQKVKDIFSGNLDKGYRNFSIDGNSLPQGIYFVNVQCGKETVSKKFVIVK